MLIMGSEWHLRGQLSEPSRFSLQTLPSVRELIESTDSTFHHHPTSSGLPASSGRPVSRSTPPTAPTQPNSASAPAAPEHPSWNPVNHASPHVRQVVHQAAVSDQLTRRHSPTNTTTPASASDHQTYQFHLPRTTATPFAPSLTSGAPAYPQPPINSNSARQDSFFPRFETTKETQPITTSPNLPFPPARRSPNDSRVVTSSRPNSSPTATSTSTSTSPIAAPTQAHANHSNTHPKAPTPRRTNSRPHSSSTSSSGASFAVQHVPAPAQSHSDSRGMQELATVEQQGSTQTRQQRFNVRFASSNNYSPTTFAMAPTPKPRSSPPAMPASPASPVETIESPKSTHEQPITTSVEQSKITRNDIRNMTDPAQEMTRQQRRSPSVERCMGCNEAWKRPLPDFRKPADIGPTKNGNDLATGNMSIIEQLRAHGRNAEMAHDKWRERHYHCVPRESHEPLSKNEQDDSRSTRSSGSNGTPREVRSTQNGPTKRVRDASSDVEQASKVRKVTFESE
ncbi:hypothetical protein J1614_012047 [Plenodomus biglobosus]|nr:hypothetical protein J1614_012047 [Plenodomus biglobosus]